MARITLEIDRNHYERVLGFGEVRQRFSRASTTQTVEGVPTIHASALGIEAVGSDGDASDVPVLDLTNLVITDVDER